MCICSPVPEPHYVVLCIWLAYHRKTFYTFNEDTPLVFVWNILTYRSDSLECARIYVGEYVSFRVGEYLECDCTVMVLQRGDVIVPNRKICPRVDLIPEKERKKNLF